LSPEAAHERMMRELGDELAARDQVERSRKAEAEAAAKAAAVAAHVAELNAIVPDPATNTEPVRFDPLVMLDELPDTAGELFDRLQKSTEVAEAAAIIQKLSKVYNRDICEDNADRSDADFHPLVLTAIGKRTPASVSSFVMFLMPLRRRLADFFQARTPDV